MVNFGLVVAIGVTILVVVLLLATAKIVPQKEAFIIERLGKYSRTLWVAGGKNKYYKHLLEWTRGGGNKAKEYDGLTGASTATRSATCWESTLLPRRVSRRTTWVTGSTTWARC